MAGRGLRRKGSPVAQLHALNVLHARGQLGRVHVDDAAAARESDRKGIQIVVLLQGRRKKSRTVSKRAGME